jgi:two-component sensor histidine kinase
MGCSAPKPDFPQPQGGVLDLRSVDFSKGVRVPLTGSWDFLPGSVDIPLDAFMASHPVQRMVPDLWKGDEAGGTRGHGSGTYHLTVLLPPRTPLLALHYLSAATALQIEVQGKVVVQVGTPSTDPALAVAAYKPGFARLEPAQERLDIMVRVSNYVYRVGGLWYPIFLGSAATIEARHLTELAVALAQSMALTVMGLILLLLYCLRRKEKAYLFSSLLTLLLSLRILVTGQYILTSFWPGIPFDFMIRIEYFTVFVPFSVVAAFFVSLFPRLMDRRLGLAISVPPLAFASLILLAPLDLLTRSLFYFFVFSFFYISVLAVSLFVNTVLKRDVEGTALFVGAVLLGAAVVNDFFFSSFVWWTGDLTPWGLLAFVGLLVVIMVRRMTKAFEGVEELLVEKELLIKEIHHRVKNSLQVVASLISLQSNRVEDPRIKDVFSALRQRIVSMSLVHEKLYGKVASDSMDLGDYLRDLIALHVAKDRFEEGSVRLSIETETVQADVDSCFDAGLIVTELVSNALKHGLLPKGGGALRVAMTREGTRVRILVEDDGPGFPPGFRPSEANSLGYKLVLSLLKKDRGMLEVLAGPGGRIQAELEIGLGALSDGGRRASR